MDANKKLCPCCGEEIMASAKKCRFCGEWIADASEVLAPETVSEATPVYGNEGAAPLQGSSLGAPAAMPPAVSQASAVVQPQMAQPGAPQGAAPYQPVINIQVAQETNVSQEVNQEVDTVVEVESKKSNGILTWEIIAVAGAAWWGSGHWWVGLLTFIGLWILILIPFIGAAACVVLGCACGLLAGAISAAFSAPTWVCWVIGLLVAAGVSAMNLEDREVEQAD